MKPLICLGIILVFSILILGCTTEIQKADDTGVTPEAVSNVVSANNQFAFDMYSALKAENENVFFSPYSISTAFAVAYEGARGQTAEEIQAVLHFPEDNAARRAAFANIYNELNKNDEDYTLSTANALWAQKDYAFLPEYLETGQKYYSAKTTNLDFINNNENSVKIINDWVEKQTNDKIKDLIESLDPMTRLVITNAIYFKGTWVLEFDKSDTREADFKVSPEKTVKCQMMSLHGEKAEFNYAWNEQLQIIELPYKGEEISMIILLPRENDIGIIEKQLTEEKLSEWKQSMRKTKLNVYLPKFKFETKYFMKETLSGMGMLTPFKNDGSADFSGMDGTNLLYIDEVIHQAYVDVNEEGTEAAAATAIVMRDELDGPPTEFRADQPFIFVIQQKASGNILFIGRVMDPSA